MLKLIKKIKYLLTIILFIIIILLAIYLKRKLNNQNHQDIILNNDTNLELKTHEYERETETQKLCSVDIKGAISKPGVYLLDCHNNINDAITIAGGLLANSDTSVINLAKKINDEMVIIIYTKEEVKNSNIVNTVVKTVEKECICPNIQNDGCINEEITDNINQNNQDLININTASLEELLTLPGIGESKAKAIIKYREEQGPFEEIDEILNVDGIGSKLYEEIKVHITT